MLATFIQPATTELPVLFWPLLSTLIDNKVGAPLSPSG
jgi:hypothetical protein